MEAFKGIGKALFAIILLIAAGAATAMEPDQLPADGLAGAKFKSAAALQSRGPRSRIGQGHANSGTQVLDTLLNWNGHFNATGVDSSGASQVIWYYNMVGNRPELGGTTFINAPIVPVSVDLRDYDGSPRYVNGQRLYLDATQYVTPVLNSPVFQNASYGSSPIPTQITDAVMRAEFSHSAKSDWHTLLSPAVKTPRVMTLARGTYRFALNADGSCCAYILAEDNNFGNQLFPPAPGDTTTVVGQAETAGDITTQDLSIFLFPNTFLYDGVPGTPGYSCCILGYHTFDYEPVGIGQAFVLAYASWISPGIFGAGFQDITALSHEVAESFNDPLVAYDNVHDITPWWLSPNGNCQNNLEVGDVIEGLPSSVYPVTIYGMTYHPQNEALLQWFAREAPSSAFGGAYSYPDTTTLTALSPPENVNCN